MQADQYQPQPARLLGLDELLRPASLDLKSREHPSWGQRAELWTAYHPCGTMPKLALEQVRERWHGKPAVMRYCTSSARRLQGTCLGDVGVLGRQRVLRRSSVRG